MNSKMNLTSIASISIGAALIIGLSSSGNLNPRFESFYHPTEQQVKDLPTQLNEAFKPGEILSYRLHYGLMDAAVAILEVKPELKQFGSRECYHIVGTGTSKGTFDFFFKVRDRYESLLDKDALLPWQFTRNCYEGGYNINQNYFFNHYTNKVDVGNGETFSFPKGTHDMVSAFYAARNLNFAEAKEGDVFALNCFLDKENWPLQIRYVGKETIKTDIGKIRCIKFRPIVQRGRVFKKEEDLNVWISDDKNHLPIRVEAKVLVGSVKMDITNYKNLANELSLVK